MTLINKLIKQSNIKALENQSVKNIEVNVLLEESVSKKSDGENILRKTYDKKSLTNKKHKKSVPFYI